MGALMSSKVDIILNNGIRHAVLRFLFRHTSYKIEMFVYFAFLYSSPQRVMCAQLQESSFAFLCQATAKREPIPAPGGRRWDRQPERREGPGIEPETSRPSDRRLTTCANRAANMNHHHPGHWYFMRRKMCKVYFGCSRPREKSVQNFSLEGLRYWNSLGRHFSNLFTCNYLGFCLFLLLLKYCNVFISPTS